MLAFSIYAISIIIYSSISPGLKTKKLLLANKYFGNYDSSCISSVSDRSNLLHVSLNYFPRLLSVAKFIKSEDDFLQK